MRIKCKGYRRDYGDWGWDYECGYENAHFECDQCICTGGSMSPVSGKEFRGNPEPYS